MDKTLKEEAALDPTSTKKRRRRSSAYMALLKDDEGEGVRYIAIENGPSVKSIMKRLVDDKRVGEIVIVCVHKKIVGSIQETLVYS